MRVTAADYCFGGNADCGGETCNGLDESCVETCAGCCAGFGSGNPLLGFPFIIDKPRNGEMNDDDEIRANVPNQSTQIERDEAFCARMREAIAAGLENAPIGVVTTPSTKNPRYVATEPRPLVSSQRDVEHT